MTAFCRCDKFTEDGMCLIRAALEFGMRLHAEIEIVLRKLDLFDESAVRRKAAEHHTALLKRLTVVVVELIAMTMTLLYLICAIAFFEKRSLFYAAGA